MRVAAEIRLPRLVSTSTYLESTNPANDQRYHLLGFEPVLAFGLADNGPTVRGMWRQGNKNK